MITNQAYLFLIFVVNGIAIGLLFDLFRILRKSFKTNDFFTYIEDIIFWILTGIILLYSIFTFNNGEIRLFMFLGLFIGILMYMLMISSYIIKINVYIINLLKKIIGFIIHIFAIPFQYIYILLRKTIFRPILFLFINIRKISTNSFKKIKFSIRNPKISNNKAKNWK